MKPIFCPKGFSLTEVIVTLLLISIVAASLYSYFSSAFITSSKMLENIQKYYDLHTVMENITADYALNYPEWQKRQPRWQKLTYYTTNTLIRAAGDKGYIYKCIAAGKSGDTEPTEPTRHDGFDSGALSVSEGTTPKWAKVDGLVILRDNIANNYYANPTFISNNYGIYMVTENKFIKFVPDGIDHYKEDVGDYETILKVTITNESGATLTSLFTNVN